MMQYKHPILGSFPHNFFLKRIPHKFLLRSEHKEDVIRNTTKHKEKVMSSNNKMPFPWESSFMISPDNNPESYIQAVRQSYVQTGYIQLYNSHGGCSSKSTSTQSAGGKKRETKEGKK